MSTRPSQRTSVMTHMAWVPEQWREAAARTLDGLGRAASLADDPAPPPSRRRARRARRRRRPALLRDRRRRGLLRGDRASRSAARARTRPRASSSPLLVTDLPAFLRWRGDLPFGSTELEQLARRRRPADRRLGRVGGSRAAPSRACPSCSTGSPRPTSPGAGSTRGGARSPGSGPRSASSRRCASTGPKAEALLLAGWLGGRLGREVTLEHEHADDDHGGRGRRRRGRARPPGAAKTPSDLLSEQLDIFGRDPIYEEAVRSFSRVAI